MSDVILNTILTLSGLGVASAIILHLVAQKFLVEEDPRVDEVVEILPAANCGGCGYAGCRNFAEACVSAGSLSALFCPVGGNESMAHVAKILGQTAVAQDSKISVLLCNGNCEVRPKTNFYDGASACSISALLYSGDTGCQYGCLGHGDCVKVCSFGAIFMDPFSGLPVIDDGKCTSCGACVKACPKNLFELRKRHKKDRKIYIACKNEEKGGIAKKSCEVACIGCNKCYNICPHEAISITNNLAYIDSYKCKLCRKCASECPTNSIIEVGFTSPKIKDETLVSSTESTHSQENSITR